MTLAQTISVWMTAAMSLHRFIGVCLPYRSGTILHTQNIRTLIICVLVTSVVFNTTRFFEVIFFYINIFIKRTKYIMLLS